MRTASNFNPVFPRTSVLLAVLFLITICTSAVWAAIPISTSTPYIQDFDAIGSTATATLPTDFKVDNPATVRTVGNYANAVSATVRLGGASLSTTAANGIYNFGSGTTTSGGTDRAVGFLSSGSATASGNLYAQLQNNTGSPVTALQISYGVEKYRGGSNAAGFRVQLFYSTDGINWTSAGDNFLTNFAADASNSGFATAPGATVGVNNQVLSVTIPNGSIVYLAWNYSVASGSTTTNAQALGVDDISILGIGNGPTNPTGAGFANPSTVQASAPTLLSVAVTPGANPPSTGLTVAADLSSIGGSAAQQFFDDGSHGDALAGDNVFSFQATVPAATSAGGKSLPVSLLDAQGRSGSTSISLTVTPSSTPPTGFGAANPNSLNLGDTTLLTVAVTPGGTPTSTGITVSGDLGQIGGSGSQKFFDDGSHGDAVAGDNVFSFQIAIASGTSPGAKSLPISISDAQSRINTASISLSIIPPPPPMTVKISQVYGGGGNSGATYTNDFIEIFNQSGAPVDVSGWTVQYGSATVTTWSATPLCPSGTCIIAPYHYFLVQESAGAGGTTGLPTPDASGGILMSGTQAKVALVASTVVLNGACPVNPAIVDLVGYGASNCSEVSPAKVLSNTTASVRKNNGCIDTDNNLNDFVVVGPIPRNSAAPANYCGGDPARLSGVGIGTPGSLEPASETLLTVTVTPATNPPSTNTKVVADLTPIGGAATQPFFEDATHGDQTAVDNTFSFEATIGPFIPTGVKNILTTISDDEEREETEPITLTIQSPTCGVERWSVKVGVDPDAPQVNLNNPIPTTIDNLRSFPAPVDPPGPPDNARLAPAETTVWVVDGTITLFKKETDVDYHIVLQDDNGHTIVTEIPSPACLITTDPPRLPAPSPFSAAIANVRAKFDAKFTATPSFQQASVPVRMTGVGFFDFIHGQTGVAPNGIELHPILDINFLNQTTTTLMSSVSPSRFREPVTFTATVMANSTTIPTGQVTFYDGGDSGGTIIGKAPLNSNGQATLTTDALSSGPHSITAVYEGDDSSTKSTSAAIVQTVDTPPVLTLPVDFTVEATSPAGAVVMYMATAVDQNNGSISVLCNPASGGIFPLGMNTVSCTTEDARHNIVTGEFHVNVVDTTAPVVLVTGVTDGANYVLGSVPAAGCSTVDSVSTIAANASVKVMGGTANGVGSFTATCTGGKDAAGNLAQPVSATYTVSYAWSGFLPPVSNGNVDQAGSTIPLKWVLANGQGALAGNPSSLASLKIAANPDCAGGPEGAPFPVATPGNSGLTYFNGEFQINWQTKDLTAGCYSILLGLDDGSTRSTIVQLKSNGQ